MKRVINWIADVVRDPQPQAQVHFHQGPESTPAVCYDTRCRYPRLDAASL
jgi:hypothetical protein